MSTSHTTKKFLFIIPLIILVVGAFVSGVLISKSASSEKTYVDQSASQTSVLGASVSTGSISVKVTDVKEEQAKGDNDQITKRITVTVDIANNSPKPIEFSPGLNLIGLDATGNQYAPTMKFGPVDKVIGGPISSGSSQTFEIDFEVPSSVGLSKLAYSVEPDSEKIEISL